MWILNCVLGTRRWAFLPPCQLISCSLGLFKGRLRKESWKCLTTGKSAWTAFLRLKGCHVFICGKSNPVCVTAAEDFGVMCAACSFRCFALLVWVNCLVTWTGMVYRQIIHFIQQSLDIFSVYHTHCFETNPKASSPTDADWAVLQGPVSVQLRTGVCLYTSRGLWLGRHLYLLGQRQNCPGRIPTKKVIQFCYSLFLPCSVSHANKSPALKMPIWPKYAWLVHCSLLFRSLSWMS